MSFVEQFRSAPLLTVIIPAYNVEEFIGPALQSVLAQSYRNLEVIVVNDGSTDETAEHAASFNDPRLRIISRPNGGLSAARNTGLDAANGKYIALLDGDDLWFPGYATAHLAALEGDPSLGISYSHLAYIDERGDRTGQLLTTNVEQPSLMQLVNRNSLSSHVVVRRECFEHAGLFNEKLRACEDHEMWVRILHRTGFHARRIPQVLSGYRVRSTSLTMNFPHQLAFAHAVADIFERDLGISRWRKRRCLAEAYRIASRKALSNAQTQTSADLLKSSLRFCPWLPLCDLRASGTLLLVLLHLALPERLCHKPYVAARHVMKLYYAFSAKKAVYS